MMGIGLWCRRSCRVMGMMDVDMKVKVNKVE